MRKTDHTARERGIFGKVFIASVVACMFISSLSLASAYLRQHTNDEQSAFRTLEISGGGILNFDGDVSLSAHEDKRYWNPHKVGLKHATVWNISFGDEALIILETSKGEAGHIATGMWWTAGFRSGEKIPLYPWASSQICVDLDVRVDTAEYEGTDEWLRIALACAVQRADGSVVYTEMDFWDSPNTQKHPDGNAWLGGDIIYQGLDVVELKIDQIPLGRWKHYHVDLTSHIDRAWKVNPGDRLESVYIVVESINNPVKIIMKADNLWIRSHASLKSPS